jgi:hypothetical protein
MGKTKIMGIYTLDEFYWMKLTTGVTPKDEFNSGRNIYGRMGRIPRPYKTAQCHYVTCEPGVGTGRAGERGEGPKRGLESFEGWLGFLALSLPHVTWRLIASPHQNGRKKAVAALTLHLPNGFYKIKRKENPIKNLQK